MNKAELIRALAERASLSRADAQKAVDALFSVDRGIVAEALRNGERVQIPGFGSFEAKRKEARTGRNPRTGAEIEIAPSVSAAFRAGKSLKESFDADVHGPGGGGRGAAALRGGVPSDTHGAGGGGRK